MAEQIKINSLVPPTWNRLKVNDITVNMPAEAIAGTIADEVTTSPADSGDWNIETGCGADLTAFLENNGTKPVLVKTEGEKLLSIKTTCTGNTADVLCFEAGDGETINILTDITSDDSVEATSVLRVLIKAGKGAKVNLAQVIRPGKGVTVVNDIGTVAEEKAQINIIQVISDGTDIYAGCRTNLKGKEAAAESRVGLVRTNGQTLDMNYVMKHLAPKTKAEINVSGALSKKAQKTFRGTIDFVRGCSESDGAEAENMLLLDDTVVNKTVPLILCTEENVAGSHGATIGRLDEDLIFYMQTRGFEEEEIYRLISRSKLVSFCDKILDEDIRNKTMTFLSE